MRFTAFLFIILLFSNCYVYKADTFENAESIPDIKKQIQANQIYKLNVNNDFIKVKAIEWEGDSLVTQVNLKDNDIRKFHTNEILEVQQRTFARGRSDAITFGLYGGIAALIILLSR